jgi:hypothetical protein
MTQFTTGVVLMLFLVLFLVSRSLKDGEGAEAELVLVGVEWVTLGRQTLTN